jgi:phosphoribosylamine--glycine ligase
MPTAMNILLIGSGGREHALAWAISASPLTETLFCAPGNAGIAEVATCITLDTDDSTAVIAFCAKYDIGLVVVGPEAPLVAGLADELATAGIKVFGPSKAAAQLEGSKGFTKDLCRAANIPTAAYARFTAAEPALAYLETQTLPIVIKADGLAAGKGVVIAETMEAARAAVSACFDGAFGAAGAEVVIEAFLTGEEASFFVLCDGDAILPLATAQDHKRVGDGDTGPNTGGMGAYSPAPVMTAELCEQTIERIIKPTVAEMAKRGMPFKGVLYAGLMITDSGPQLIEYNVRFGDPECQALMMRLKSDIVPALLACADGVLANVDLRWHDDAAMTIVVANEGYPGAVTPRRANLWLGRGGWRHRRCHGLSRRHRA